MARNSSMCGNKNPSYSVRDITMGVCLPGPKLSVKSSFTLTKLLSVEVKESRCSNFLFFWSSKLLDYGTGVMLWYLLLI